MCTFPSIIHVFTFCKRWLRLIYISYILFSHFGLRSSLKCSHFYLENEHNQIFYCKNSLERSYEWNYWSRTGNHHIPSFRQTCRCTSHPWVNELCILGNRDCFENLQQGVWWRCDRWLLANYLGGISTNGWWTSSCLSSTTHNAFSHIKRWLTYNFRWDCFSR